MAWERGNHRRELPSTMATSMQSTPVEDQRVVPGPQQPKVNFLKAILEAHVADDALESAFHGCVKRVLIPDRGVRPDLQETLRALFTTSSAENWVGLYLDQYVSFLSAQSNHQRVVYLLDTLTALVADGTIHSKLVCLVLLKHLDVRREVAWCESLKRVKSIIGGVDYKGCRELMKLLFVAFDGLPRSVPEQQIPALQQGKELLKYILDRNASLLPAYFAHDEIQRHYPDKEHTAHWILQEVIVLLQSSMRATADLVSGIVQPHLRPVLGVSNISVSVWRLDPNKHCCALKGLLPYRESLVRAQEDLLYHVMVQPNSKDAVHSVLGMNRQQLQQSLMVEDALVRLGMAAMELSETSCGMEEEEERRQFEVWSHFASQLVFFYFLQLINIPSVLTKLRKKLSQSKCRKGRHWLMWSLLHFVTSTLQSKQPQQVPTALLKEFVPITNLFSLLFQDREPLPIPDSSNPSYVYEMSAASLWIVYRDKAKADDMLLPHPIPYVLSKQIEWIQQQSEDPPPPSTLPSDFSTPLLLNVYSNNNEVCVKLLNTLLDAMVPPLPESHPTPLSLSALNTLAMHAKIRLMEKVKGYLVKVAESAKQPQPTITAALLEAYSRLLIWLGTRNFQTHLIPAVFKSQAWGVLYVLLEIISFRVHLQLQFSYRFQLLQQLHTVANVSIIPSQLFISAENAALRLIGGLVSPDFLIQLAKQFTTDPKPLLSTESEELNRVFVLVVAQCLQISNMDATNWLEPFMRTVLTSTPNSWSETMLAFFPATARQFCSLPNLTAFRVALINKVEEEHKRFKGTANEMEQIRLFSETESSALFLCVLWKVLMETGTVSPVCIKIAQRTQPKKLAAQMRRLVDYIIFTLPPLGSSPNQLNSVILRLNELVWKYNVFPLDRLVLCMALRGYDSHDTLMCLTVLYCLLLGTQEFSQRASTLVKEVPADYWNLPNWDKKHAAYLRQFQETFHPDIPGMMSPTKTAAMPMYFGNICFRFLPVFDLLLHRMLEVPEIAAQSLEKLLDRFGPLYKFHDHPVSFLYTTLHYYERTFADRPTWKRKLVSTVIGAQQNIHPLDWYFSSEFSGYLTPQEGSSWSPTQQYYNKLIDRLVKGLHPFSLSAPVCDWRFNEFSGPLPLLLHSTAVELLALPSLGKTVAKELIEALYSKADSCRQGEEDQLLAWMNALGLLFISLPESFSAILYDEVLWTLQLPPDSLPPPPSFYVLPGGNRPGCLLSLVHAYWHHTNMGVLLHLPHWMQTSLHPLVKTEWQLLFVCHLVGPLLQRLTNERPKALLEVVMEIYRLLQSVDQHQGGLLQHSDVLCDFLYHIKYMHIGDQRKEEIEQVVSSLHTPLQMRLRFLVPSLAERQPSACTPTASETMQLQ